LVAAGAGSELRKEQPPVNLVLGSVIGSPTLNAAAELVLLFEVGA
jgi:hypothetical protein